MKKKIAVLFASDIYDQKGLFLAVHNRCKHLMQISKFDIDVYVLMTYKDRIVSRLLGIHPVKKVDNYEKDGVAYRVLWRRNSILDFVLYHKLRMPEFFHNLYNKYIAKTFKHYDLLSVHSGCGDIAYICKQKYNIPYIVTWHGSDIHTAPYYSRFNRDNVIKVLTYAECNCFVSQGLYKLANTIIPIEKFEILYNGVGDLFYVYPQEERVSIRRDLNVNEKKIVAFIGNIIEVKNPLILPIIFTNVHNKYAGNLEFWFIGDGELRKSLECRMGDTPCKYKFWGNQKPEEIPRLLQCINVVILPSLNEGFGLTVLEALSCGANAVGSNVGGMQEVLGSENVFDLNNAFVEKISDRIVHFLTKEQAQYLNPEFSWVVTAKKENRIIENVFKNGKKI